MDANGIMTADEISVGTTYFVERNGKTICIRITTQVHPISRSHSGARVTHVGFNAYRVRPASGASFGNENPYLVRLSDMRPANTAY